MISRLLVRQKPGVAALARHAPGCRLASSVGSTEAEADYVILGAGSAGCVLAERLSASGEHSVLLVEAGPPDKWAWDSWKIHMPAALTYNLADDKYNWDYHTAPQPGLDGRSLPWPRGRVAGGSSSLNAMVYIRGHALDYERWAEEIGAAEWGYGGCLPYFRRAEGHTSLPADPYVGTEGPLRVSRHNAPNALFDAFVAAGEQAGYARTEDLNGFRNEGFGPMDMTVHDGARWSAADAYLRPAEGRANLKVRHGEIASRVLFERDSDGGAEPRAVGVEVEAFDRGGRGGSGAKHVLRARQEVISCGGAINSPQLLLLSGVGPEGHLREHGIDVVAHSPGVGRNLQDHLDLYVQMECLSPTTLYTCSWDFPHRMVAIGAEWFARRTGLAASNHLESGGFIRTRAGKQHPDLQYHFLPGALTGQLTPGKCHAFQAHCSTMRATSTGFIELASTNPHDHPTIDPCYLSTAEDVDDLRAGVRLTQEIFAQPAFDGLRGAPISPPAGMRSDDEIDAWVRQNTESAYHPSCTCKMGADGDEMAVLDAQARVRGVSGLRVVDASIMPSVVSGNLNAPTIMLAEKLADVILGKPALPASDAPFFVPDDWETAQR